MSTPKKVVFKSTTTQNQYIGKVCAAIVGAGLGYAATYLGVEALNDPALTASLGALLAQLVDPLLSRAISSLRGTQSRLPGMIILVPALLIPALMASGCATNSATFTEFDPETGKKIYEGIVEARAGYGGSIEEANSNVNWSNDNLVHNDAGLADTSRYTLANSQTAAGLTSPDTAGTVTLGINQLAGLIIGYKQATALAEIDAGQNPPWLQLMTNANVLEFMQLIADGVLSYEVAEPATPE